MSSLISVVIPYFNQPDFLQPCLGSLARQKFDLSRAEILVVEWFDGTA